ncbi:MAG: hypothetical protein CSA81_12255 [Acidobacteria bacterium]|nr:MAG: hypothetical protein CSA81_12255 [Acidobacteriota bacterium]
MSFKKCPLCGELSFFRNYCSGFIGKSRWECKNCGKTLGFSKKRSKTIGFIFGCFVPLEIFLCFFVAFPYNVFFILPFLSYPFFNKVEPGQKRIVLSKKPSHRKFEEK